MTRRALRPLLAYATLGARALRTHWDERRPFKLTLALTDRCDCRCQGCFIWKKPKGHEMTPDEIGAFARAAPSLSWVNLTGGEPFLRDDVPDVARALCDALPRLAVLTFPTTGQRTDAVLAGVREIAALRIPRVLVTTSVEGPPALHDETRGRPGAFDRMTETFAGLRRIPGVRAYLGMTLTDRNAQLVDETLAAVRERVPGVSLHDVHFNVFTTSLHYYDNAASTLRPPAALSRRIASARRARERSWNPADRIEAAYLRHLPEHLRTGRSPLACRSLVASVFVAPGGDVHPCTVYGRRLGNVRERPLPDILADATAADARRTIARDACPGCWSPCEAHPTIFARGRRGR
jgi:MoaA/NifB/PqqE/SkfB family radical SAM enzyme